MTATYSAIPLRFYRTGSLHYHYAVKGAMLHVLEVLQQQIPELSWEAYFSGIATPIGDSSALMQPCQGTKVSVRAPWRTSHRFFNTAEEGADWLRSQLFGPRPIVEDQRLQHRIDRFRAAAQSTRNLE